MSWQQYLDQITESGATSAAICGLNGDVWAVTSGFNVTKFQVKALSHGFMDSNSICTNGFQLGNEEYYTTKADNFSIYGQTGLANAAVAKTAQAMLIGVTAGRLKPNELASIVEKLGDYIRESGY